VVVFRAVRKRNNNPIEDGIKVPLYQEGWILSRLIGTKDGVCNEFYNLKGLYYFSGKIPLQLEACESRFKSTK